MGKFAVIQAFYCISGLGFFVKDLYENVPMANGMIRAFIWPYAQWPYIHDRALHMAQPLLQMLH
ncbi:MAG: hypothetical protein K1X51_17705 [Rhodospirillaceae bacterium]|nr:hypothetical protein [Rhodospirillaceae bacterium]